MSKSNYNEIIILGAGFAGICMGIQLQKAGIKDFIIVEKADDIGGTWRDNTYPGAACDVSSHLYSYSFEQNPNWNRMFSGQKEIYNYLKHCVAKYQLESYIHFNIEILGGNYNETTGKWTLQTNKEDRECRFWVNAMGPLNRQNFPNIQGRTSFEGAAFHSSQWNHDFDLKDKKVAVVGTGASAIQIIPAIAAQVKELVVFQRSPAWVMPKPDREMSSIEKTLFRKLPFVQRLYRNSIYLLNELTALALVYKPKWTKLIEKLATLHIKKYIKEEQLRKKLLPDYNIGCKRILLSNDYYPALKQDNVEVFTKGISEINAKGIVTADGKQKNFDAIVYCTGFTASEFPQHFKVTGKDKKELLKEWSNGPEAYLGSTVAGFPNMFFIIGPNTGLGHTSMIFMIESQVNYIIDAIKKVKAQDVMAMEVKEEVQERFNREIQDKLKGTVWSSGCSSWYLTSYGKNTTVWPGFTFEFWNRNKKVILSDYHWIKRSA